MAAMIRRRTLLRVMAMFTSPHMKTIDRPSCQVNPMSPHTVTVRNEAIPRPGASAYGTLAYSAMTRVPTADDIADARNTAPHCIPSGDESIPGTVTRMYAIDRNVVKPATASLSGVVPWSCSLNGSIGNMHGMRRYNGTVGGRV